VPEVLKSEDVKAAEQEERKINSFLNMITVAPIRGSRTVGGERHLRESGAGGQKLPIPGRSVYSTAS